MVSRGRGRLLALLALAILAWGARPGGARAQSDVGPAATAPNYGGPAYGNPAYGNPAYGGPAFGGAGCASCGTSCATCQRIHCPPHFYHCVERPPVICWKFGCPRPVCNPCELPNFGYFQTCWTPWPFPPDWSHCRVPPPAAYVQLPQPPLPGVPGSSLNGTTGQPSMRGDEMLPVPNSKRQ
jgi:hypothetical protein